MTSVKLKIILGQLSLLLLLLLYTFVVHNSSTASVSTMKHHARLRLTCILRARLALRFFQVRSAATDRRRAISQATASTSGLLWRCFLLRLPLRPDVGRASSIRSGAGHSRSCQWRRESHEAQRAVAPPCYDACGIDRPF